MWEEILSRTTIKELANSILNKGFVDYMDSMILLNEKRTKIIFAFPPMIGYGICFKELAGTINTHIIYAFEFIENENRIQEYIKLIKTVQKEGPYVLMGYPAGGKLEFEVAKGLEEKGYEVSDIVLFDSSVNEESVDIFDNDKKT